MKHIEMSNRNDAMLGATAIDAPGLPSGICGVAGAIPVLGLTSLQS